MNDLTNHGVPRAFQLLWRRRPRVAAASWCKRRYGREREWRSRVGLTECGSGTSVDTVPPLFMVFLTFEDREGREVELAKGVYVNKISFWCHFGSLGGS